MVSQDYLSKSNQDGQGRERKGGRSGDVGE